MAQVDFFLKLTDIDGESEDAKHKKEIQLISWSWGESNTGAHSTAGSGGGAGKVNMHDFNFVMHTNKASPKLLLACASGDHIKEGVLTCRKSGGNTKGPQEYLKVTMGDVFVSGFQTGGVSDDTAIPVDQISLNFSKIKWEYAVQKEDGSLAPPITALWNLKLNKKAW